jgi:hypothetical protein
MEHGRRRGVAAAVTACWHSRRGAGEYWRTRRARAPWRGKGAIPVPKLAEDVVEVGRRR